MYVTMRKYRPKRSYAHVHDAVQKGLVPVLKALPGFQGYWLLKCNDGDFAGYTAFDTQANAIAGNKATLAWVEAHFRDELVLPPVVMFAAMMEQLA